MFFFLYRSSSLRIKAESTCFESRSSKNISIIIYTFEQFSFRSSACALVYEMKKKTKDRILLTDLVTLHLTLVVSASATVGTFQGDTRMKTSVVLLALCFIAAPEHCPNTRLVLRFDVDRDLTGMVLIILKRHC